MRQYRRTPQGCSPTSTPGPPQPPPDDWLTGKPGAAKTLSPAKPRTNVCALDRRGCQKHTPGALNNGHLFPRRLDIRDQGVGEGAGRAGLSPWVGPSRGSHQGDSGDQGGTHLREPLPAAAPPPSIRFPSLRVSCAEVRPLPSPPPAPSPGVSAPVTSCDAHVARTAALPARSLVTCCRDPARL